MVEGREREREREREKERIARGRERERERGRGRKRAGRGEREKKGVGGESGHVCGRKTVHVSACNSLARVRDTTEAIETSKAGSKS